MKSFASKVALETRPSSQAMLPTSSLADRHPVAKKQAELQALADRSSRVQRMAALQAMADRSPRVQGLMQVQETTNQTGMPNQLKSGLERLSNMDLSDVRVHYNSAKPADVNALAFAQGQDIHLAPGQEKQLPHEGWHVVQQMQGRVKPTIQAKGVSINDDQRMEREADVMGARALQDNPNSTGPHRSPKQQPVLATQPVQRISINPGLRALLRSIRTLVNQLQAFQEAQQQAQQIQQQMQNALAELEEMEQPQPDPLPGELQTNEPN